MCTILWENECGVGDSGVNRVRDTIRKVVELRVNAAKDIIDRG